MENAWKSQAARCGERVVTVIENMFWFGAAAQTSASDGAGPHSCRRRLSHRDVQHESTTSPNTHARQPHRRATNKPWLCFQWLSKLKRTECESDCSWPLSYIYWLNCGQSLWSVSPHLQCLTWGTHRATCLYPAPCYAAFVKGNLPGGELTESGCVVQRDESRVEFIEGGKIRRMRSKWTRPAERPAQAQTPSLAM